MKINIRKADWAKLAQHCISWLSLISSVQHSCYNTRLKEVVPVLSVTKHHTV